MTNARPTRLYQALTERITRMIASGQFKIGDRLPAERELASMYDVSRPTIREAIIALEIEGLVEVKVGSGVYVSSNVPTRRGVERDIGAFELTEARILLEGEVAALAAANITDEDLEELDVLLVEMEEANRTGVGELVDKRFHAAIGNASRNSAMHALVEHLWLIRDRSPQCILTFEKTRDKGHKPVIEEHRLIVEALRQRDPVAARKAMRDHLTRVLQYLLESTEFDAVEEVRAKAAEQRNRFGLVSRI